MVIILARTSNSVFLRPQLSWEERVSDLRSVLKHRALLACILRNHLTSSWSLLYSALLPLKVLPLLWADYKRLFLLFLSWFAELYGMFVRLLEVQCHLLSPGIHGISLLLLELAFVGDTWSQATLVVQACLETQESWSLFQPDCMLFFLSAVAFLRWSLLENALPLVLGRYEKLCQSPQLSQIL